MFASGILARLRSTQLAHMGDTCVRLAYSRTYDDYNAPVDHWSDAGGSVPCGLDMQPGSERSTDNLTVVSWDAVLRISISEVWDPKDRVRVTHRFGEALAVPLVYGLVAPPQRGPSALQLRLRKVDI